ncbi:MAG: hypothetical protein LiPW30_570 [Parcubacteria group bacterium LiPW_30]|nr:MAG: hypothetical protein LiPW30_570 [Parcubacteria group bacterium LiPW_30]
MNKTNNRGFFKLILIIAIGILILSALNLNLRDIVNSPAFKDNITYISDLAKNVWEDYLRTPVMFFWNTTFKNVVIVPFAENMRQMISGQGTSTFFSLVPQFNIPMATTTGN